MMMMLAACSILSLQRELMAEIESGQQPGDPNSLPLSQERLICKAASLSYFLTNEVAVAPVSSAFSYNFCNFALCVKEQHLVRDFKRFFNK